MNPYDYPFDMEEIGEERYRLHFPDLASFVVIGTDVPKPRAGPV